MTSIAEIKKSFATFPTPGSTLAMIAALALFVFGLAIPAEAGEVFVSIGGGPARTPFEELARVISERVSEAYPDVYMPAEDSGGSVENVKRLDSGDLDFGIAYAGDVYQGALGRLPGDDRLYNRVRPIGRLYGLPAHLAVSVKSTLVSPVRLANQPVGVGLEHSISSEAARLYLGHLGLWDKLTPFYLEPAAGFDALEEAAILALWFLDVPPHPALVQGAEKFPFRLVPLQDDAEVTGFFEAYPFYTPAEIPAGAYPGQSESVPTFQDSALLCTHEGVDMDVVYRVTKALWSEQGLAVLRRTHPATRDVSVEAMLTGIARPLAKGAYKFQVETGRSVPETLRPPDLATEDIEPREPKK